MSQAPSAQPEPLQRRHRHRSLTRKLLESLALFVGVPLLLFALLALSVDLIEYRPTSAASVTPPAAPVPGALPALD